MLKTETLPKGLDLGKALYAYINSYITNSRSENAPKSYFQNTPQNLHFCFPDSYAVAGVRGTE